MQANSLTMTLSDQATGATTVFKPVGSLQQGRAPICSLRLKIPEYLDRELAQQAFDERVTKQFLVVQALRGARLPRRGKRPGAG